MDSSPPFAVILPSRPVLTKPQIISHTELAFSFPATPAFSHIVVCFLPGFEMPKDVLAGIYIKTTASAPGFRLLGAIGADNQSAIFKLQPSESVAGLTTIILGISIEPTGTLSQQLSTSVADDNSPDCNIAERNGLQPLSTISTKILAQRIIGNAFNFLASFAGHVGSSGQEVVPLKAFQDWWAKFERRIENDPAFLVRGES